MVLNRIRYLSLSLCTYILKIFCNNNKWKYVSNFIHMLRVVDPIIKSLCALLQLSMRRTSSLRIGHRGNWLLRWAKYDYSSSIFYSRVDERSSARMEVPRQVLRATRYSSYLSVHIRPFAPVFIWPCTINGGHNFCVNKTCGSFHNITLETVAKCCHKKQTVLCVIMELISVKADH